MGKRKQKKESSSTTGNGGPHKSCRVESGLSSQFSEPPNGGAKEDSRLLWGPYLSERQWGTVREDLSADGSCWESFTHEQAVYRSYRWGEDGLFGFSDDQAQLCLSLALWNGQDPILKERLYGMSSPQGNHGEDVKECYYYLDSTPSHSYLKALYKYPQCTFPYNDILEESESRTALKPEYELLDTGAFDDNRYFDVYAEYAKRTDKDILCKYTVHNRADSEADIHIIPQIWFRNTWSGDKSGHKPCKMQKLGDGVICSHPKLGKYIFEFEKTEDESAIYTENETNISKLEPPKETKSKKGKVTAQKVSKETHTLAGKKDAFHEYIVHGNIAALNAKAQGTKLGVHYHFQLPANSHVTVKCRLVSESEAEPISFDEEFDAVFANRIREADEYYKQIIPTGVSNEQAAMVRQAYAGLCWNKQFFSYDRHQWLKPGRKNQINPQWSHMSNSDVISMPDKWEFPWYATWDLAFHMIPMADLDLEFTRNQLLLLLSQRYMHPNGQLPAYEFDFSDVNPPVHAMAVLHVYRKQHDHVFLLQCFNKLIINFNWWMNTKQIGNTFLFGGGFLGMDNVSCLHRSLLPEGCTLYQVDGTCWMAYFSLCMMQIALELSYQTEAYVDMVVLYMDHFLSIAFALNFGLNGTGLWDEQDKFYYDSLRVKDEKELKVLRVRAMIGLTALFPVYKLPMHACEKLPQLKQKIYELFLLRSNIVDKLGLSWDEHGLLLCMFPRTMQYRLEHLLRYMGDESEFLAPGGIRALSKFHEKHPFVVEVSKTPHTVEYNAGESRCDMFGGNSNWRGPVWFPMNYLLVESLHTFRDHYGDSLQVVCGNFRCCDVGTFIKLICTRLVSLFLQNKNGCRPCHGSQTIYSRNPHWKGLVLFYEYFDGDTGRGCGASHQTGWTALVTTILKRLQSM